MGKGGLATPEEGDTGEGVEGGTGQKTQVGDENASSCMRRRGRNDAWK